jgi:nitroreductase
MDFEILINKHRSIRKYKDKKIPDDLLNKILNLSIRSSTAGNMQSYSIILIKDEQKRKDFYKQYHNQEMVIQAPLLIAFCSDFNRQREWSKINNADVHYDDLLAFLIGVVDASIVAQSFALGCENEGLGICYLGSALRNMERTAEFLKLPKNVLPVTLMVVGYPDEDAECKDRLPLEALVHNNSYKDYSAEEIANYYKEKDIKGWQRYKEMNMFKNLIEETAVENLAQLYSNVKYTKESHRKASESILRCLKKYNLFNFN